LLSNDAVGVAERSRYAARDPATVGRARLRVVVVSVRIACMGAAYPFGAAASRETSAA
jgi:hypothetical protein